MQSNPVIVFTEEDPAALFNVLRKECFQAGMVFELVTTDDNATKLRKNATVRISGVFVLDTRYCRGYDMKLWEDARVLKWLAQKDFRLVKLNKWWAEAAEHLANPKGSTTPMSSVQFS